MLNPMLESSYNLTEKQKADKLVELKKMRLMIATQIMGERLLDCNGLTETYDLMAEAFQATDLIMNYVGWDWRLLDKELFPKLYEAE